MANFAPGFTMSVKLPSKSVMVPFVVPISSTDAPIIASPFAASVTVPFATFCAKAATEPSTSNKASEKERNILILFFFIVLMI